MPIEPRKPFPTTPKADALVRIVHPELAAEKLGVTVKQVLARRAELGLSSVDEQFAKSERGRHAR